jgi:hypothetical protein
MHIPFKTALAVASCMVSSLCPCASAADVAGVTLEESVHVAGHQLQLNGAGVSSRLVFKIYAIGLYLQDHRRTPEAVLSSRGPRRLFIRLLRDVSSEEFEDAVLNKLAASASQQDNALAGHMLRLGKAIASQPQGLRQGDLLTLDWIPGTGTVVELNRRPLTPPLQDIAFYNALLNIWLGDKPADARLKTGLLGHTPV